MPTPTLINERLAPFAGEWGEVLLTAEDPLAAWKSQFSEWLNDFEQFRSMEDAAFFPNIHDPIISRVHRGWISVLISRGERLAVDLIQGDGPRAFEKREQLGFVDAFITNLRSDFALWHLGDEMEAALKSECGLR